MGWQSRPLSALTLTIQHLIWLTRFLSATSGWPRTRTVPFLVSCRAAGVGLEVISSELTHDDYAGLRKSA